MAPIPVEEQFRFLLSCIRFSNNGKIDFEKVASECEIISKGAAAKRYERLLKANNIIPAGGSTQGSLEKSANDTSATATLTKKPPGGVKRKKAESAGSPKKAKVMKKAAVMCAEDLVRKEFDDGSDDGKGDGNEDDTDGSLFRGIAGEPEAHDAYA